MILAPILKKTLDVGDTETARGRALLHEQFASLLRQVPLLYVVILLNGFGLAYAFAEIAPPRLVYGVPGVLAIFAAVRLTQWLHLYRHPPPDAAAILRQLRQTTLLAIILSTCFGVWSFLLLAYGEEGRQAIASIFISMSAIGSAYCLGMLPMAARAIILVAATPVALSLVMSGNPFLMGLGFNLAMLGAMMLFIMDRHFRRFVELMNSRDALTTEMERATEAEARYRASALTDELTGLPNRRAFITALESMIVERQSRRAGETHFAVGMLDLDGFKPINDTYGHAAGDIVLREVAKRLRQAVRGSDLVARFGGDEFAVLLSGIDDKEGLHAVGALLRAELARPFVFDDTTVCLSGSCGFALFPEAGNEAARLIDRADTALYHVKRKKTGDVAVFSFDLEEHLQRRTRIEQGLRQAVDAEAIGMMFQPIVDLKTGTLCSFEALARWRDDELGDVPPVEFIPVAEQIGLIGKLTDLLFKKAVQPALSWPREISLAFNMSALQLAEQTTALRMISAMNQAGFNPRRLEVEISETALALDFEVARHTIDALRSAGVRIVLDDFGTRHTSLGYLREIAFDVIKVDGSFVDPLKASEQERLLLPGILEMCRTLGVPCVAERIETSCQLEHLNTMQCARGQGFHFAPPMKEADALMLASKGPVVLETAQL